jgi:hypothetical protein
MHRLACGREDAYEGRRGRRRRRRRVGRGRRRVCIKDGV